MKVEVRVTKGFKRQAKPLLKKYHSLREELMALQIALLAEPTTGVHISEDVYKIRLSVKSKGRGKSGGLRIITFLNTILLADIEHDANEGEVEINNISIAVNLIAIYDKSDTGSISDQEIRDLIANIDFNEE